MRSMCYLVFVLMVFSVGCTTADARFVVDGGVRDKLNKLLDQQTVGTSNIAEKLDEQTAVLVAIREKLNEPPKSTGGAETPDTSTSPSETAPPVEKKPVLYYSVTTNCGMCNQLKADIASGLLDDFDMQLLEDDTWSLGYPALRWLDSSGNWKYLTYNGGHVGYQRYMIPDLKEQILGIPKTAASAAPVTQSPMTSTTTCINGQCTTSYRYTMPQRQRRGVFRIFR